MTVEPTLAHRYAQRRDAFVRRAPGSVLVLTSQGEEPMSLRGTAIEVWDALAEPTTIAELVDTLAERYDREQEARLERDVAELVLVLESRGGLTRS